MLINKFKNLRYFSSNKQLNMKSFYKSFYPNVIDLPKLPYDNDDKLKQHGHKFSPITSLHNLSFHDMKNIRIVSLSKDSVVIPMNDGTLSTNDLIVSNESVNVYDLIKYNSKIYDNMFVIPNELSLNIAKELIDQYPSGTRLKKILYHIDQVYLKQFINYTVNKFPILVHDLDGDKQSLIDKSVIINICKNNYEMIHHYYDLITDEIQNELYKLKIYHKAYSEDNKNIFLVPKRFVDDSFIKSSPLIIENLVNMIITNDIFIPYDKQKDKSYLARIYSSMVISPAK